MSSPRIPNWNEAERILKAAQGQDRKSDKAKAKANLLKSLEWAYKGFSDQKKQQVQAAYRASSQREIDPDLQKATLGQLTDDQVRDLHAAILATDGAALHPGANRLINLSDPQKDLIRVVNARVKVHIDVIQAGNWDLELASVFPAPPPGKLAAFDFLNSGVFGPRTQADKQVETNNKVKRTFILAYQIIEIWRQTTDKIKIDQFLDSYGAKGLSNKTNLVLAESFFDDAKMADDYREEILLHEATHAIQDDNHVTFDQGGYIGTAPWFQADTPLRLKNASHFQYIIRRVQGKAAVVPTNDDNDPNIKAATDIVRNAWIQALNIYITMWKHHDAVQKNPMLKCGDPDNEYIRKRAKLLGVSAGKTAQGTSQITEGDLAAFENRVGRLGVFLGAVKTAAGALRDAGTPVTTDGILEKLVEMYGAIRKTRNHAKTVEMMKALNTMQNTPAFDVQNLILDGFFSKNF